jgi:amino acid transporter
VIETAAHEPAIPRLRRVLGLWDLIFYGIVVIQPIAAVPLFGIGQKLSNGHMVTTILIAMLAMLLTATSYGRMASLYPVAGSAYTYVGRGLNAHLGFVTGWLIFLDYLIVPVTGIIYSSLTVQRVLTPFVPQLPPRFVFALLAGFFAAAITALNLGGIRSVAKANIALLFIMSVVIILFIGMAIHYLFHLQGWAGVFSWQPFYASSTFHLPAIATATSFAALTYIGFDSVTTLAEDVHNPRRNILLATVIVCLFTGIFSGLQIYLGQLVWPNWRTFPNLETAFMDVTRRVGGPILFAAMAVILVVSNFGAALTGQIGAARLLFSMGRDNVLPKSVFAYLDPKKKNPAYNILIIGVLAFIGAMVLSYELAAECLNFGAFLGFMGVNLAAFREFYLRRRGGAERRLFRDALLPIAGFLFCLAIWVSLPLPAKIAGSCWLLVGLMYDAVQTRGFRTAPKMVDFSDAG